MKNRRKQLKNSIFDIILITFSISIVFLIEYFLQLINFGESYPLAKIVSKNNVEYYMVNENYPKKYFSNNVINSPQFKPQYFKYEKDTNTFRIFVVGGEVINGVPYDKSINLSSILKYSLNKSIGNKNVEVVDLTNGSFNSFAINDIVKELPKYNPDLLIISTGYNEFFGIPNSHKIRNSGLKYFYIESFIFFRETRIYQLAEKIINIFKEEKSDEINYLQADYYNNQIDYKSGKYVNTRKSFLRNLYKIESVTSKYHIPVMISSVSSNFSNIPPFQSKFNDEEYLDIELNRIFSNYLEEHDNARTIDWLEDLKSWEPQSAIYYYCKANLDKLNNNKKISLRNYTIAVRLDKFHFRPLQDWNFAIKNFAKEKKWTLIDIDAVYDEYTENKINCDKIFVDHLNPNIFGYWLFANEFVTNIQRDYVLHDDNNFKETFHQFEINYPITDFTRLNQLLYKNKISNYIFDKNKTIKNTISIATKYSSKHINGDMKWIDANKSLLDYYLNNDNKEEALKYFKNIKRVYPYGQMAKLNYKTD